MEPEETPVSSREAFEEAIELLRSDRSRGFQIDVDTDSMVFEDRNAEKQQRVEFIGAISSYLKEAIPAATMYPAIAPALLEILMFGVRGFKTGRQLEAVFDEVSDNIGQMKPQQGQQDQAAQQQAAQKAETEARAQAELQKLQQQMQLEMARMKADGEKHQAQLVADARKTEADAMLKKAQMEISAQLDRERIALEREKIASSRIDSEAQRAVEGRKLELDERRVGIEAARLELDRNRAAADVVVKADQTNQRREQVANSRGMTNGDA